jgi:hypothetical protein
MPGRFSLTKFSGSSTPPRYSQHREIVLSDSEQPFEIGDAVCLKRGRVTVMLIEYIQGYRANLFWLDDLSQPQRVILPIALLCKAPGYA